MLLLPCPVPTHPVFQGARLSYTSSRAGIPTTLRPASSAVAPASTPLASRARGHSSSDFQSKASDRSCESLRWSSRSSPAVGPCGRVCQGSNPSSKLRLYSPSSRHPIRLPMKRPILHPPRPLTRPRNGSLQKLSAPCLRSTEPRCPRIQHHPLRRRPTTTTPFRALCPLVGL